MPQDWHGKSWRSGAGSSVLKCNRIAMTIACIWEKLFVCCFLDRLWQNLTLTKKTDFTFLDGLLAWWRRKDVCALIDYRVGFLINRKFYIHLSDVHPKSPSLKPVSTNPAGWFPSTRGVRNSRRRDGGGRSPSAVELFRQFIHQSGSKWFLYGCRHGQSRTAPWNASKHGPSKNTAFIYHTISIRFYQEIKKKPPKSH